MASTRFLLQESLPKEGHFRFTGLLCDISETYPKPEQDRDNFVSALREILPPGRYRVVILANRGFARVTFLQHLGKLKFKFVVRPRRRYGWNLKASREHWVP
ncbi:hypothetical protein Tph_c25950 [Thermacetogenium phaeum DSM 12270]|uniref:Uncharacterized protein n=1 Tax=Thermacetogenium phaeum (strain ATCC BAA-254 / DSM 26808 / PB) TaxID=1089553 RepID=K4LXT8_THEPS|nr:hypothetical protein Tph_c25950 [Thermacetogenium phaeum DSM 12270]